MRQAWIWCSIGIAALQISALAQIDTEKRRLIEAGYNQPMEGKAPIAAYAFYYYNQPDFMRTNLTLRLAVAPTYLDSELGFKELIGPNTDVGVGLAGGGLADRYSEIRQGQWLQEESFMGHVAKVSSSIYHKLNPGSRVPAWLVGRLELHHSFYDRDDETADNFEIPDDLTTLNLRTGIRLGGREPSMTSPLAGELSIWYEGHVRLDDQRYGYNDDRQIEQVSHNFLSRALLKYTFEESQQYFDASLIFGVTLNPDRLSAYRLGGLLPLIAEFPLMIPGYFSQEISAEKFGLLNAEYSFPFTPNKSWRFTMYGAGAVVEYLDGQEQPENWHAGAGAGITYVSPRKAWFVSLVYGHGFNALRHEEKGSHQLAMMFQYDLLATKSARFRQFEPRQGDRNFR